MQALKGDGMMTMLAGRPATDTADAITANVI